MRMNASKSNVVSAFIPGEQRQAVLLDGASLEDVDEFEHCSGKEDLAGLVMLQDVQTVN